MFILSHTELLIVVLTVIVAAMYGLQYRQSRRLQALESLLAQHDERDDRLNGDLAALLECSRRVGDRLSSGERT